MVHRSAGCHAGVETAGSPWQLDLSLPKLFRTCSMGPERNTHFAQSRPALVGSGDPAANTLVQLHDARVIAQLANPVGKCRTRTTQAEYVRREGRLIPSMAVLGTNNAAGTP